MYIKATVINVIKMIKEDGEACGNASNSAGMGNITAAQPSVYAGTTIGSDFAAGGGTVGSGDVNAGSLPKRRKQATRKSKNVFSKLYNLKQDYTTPSESKKIPNLLSFKEFINK